MATILVEILGNAKQFKSELDGAVASTEKASGGFTKMSKFAGIAGVAIAGGLAVGLVKSVEAASEAQAATVRLNAAFAASHVSAKQFAGGIEDAEVKARKLGFANEDVKVSLGSLIVATHDGHKAITDLGVAQDIARFKHVSLTDATKNLTMAMAGSQRATKALGIDVPKVTSHYDTLKATMGKTIDASEKIQLAHAKLQDKMATSNKVIATVTEKLHGQAAAFADTAAGGMAQFHAQLGNLEEKVGTALLPAMTKITDALSKFVNFLSTSPGVANAAAQAMQVLSDVMGVVLTAGQALLGWMEKHQTATKAIVAGLAVLIIALSSPIVVIVALGVALIELWKHSQQFRDIVNGAIEDVKAKFQAVFPTIKAIVTESIAAAVAIAEAVWGRFGGALTSIAKTAIDTVSKVLTDFGNVVKGVVNLIGDLIHGRWNKIWGDLVTIVKGVFSAFKDMLEGEVKIVLIEAKAIGSALLDGILAGVSGLGSALKDKVTSEIGSALGGIGSFIKKGSPSRLFADEVGKPIGEGVIQGWLESSAALPDAMSKSLQAAINAGRATIQAAQSTFQAAWSQIASDADAAFNAIRGATQTKAEKALADAQAAHDKAGRDQALSDATDALTKAQAGGDPAAILAAEKSLADAKYAIHIAALQKQATAQRLDLDARNALEKRHFDEALTNLQDHLAKGHASYQDAHAAILKLFKSYGVNYSDAGADLGKAFVTGLKESIQDAAKGSGDLSGKLDKVAAGIHIPHAATGGFVAQTGLAVIHQGETITPAGQGGGVTVIVNGWVGNDQDLAQRFRNELIRMGRNTTGGALGRFG